MRVAIVGSGFSGVAVTWQLLGRLPAGSKITLINGSGRFARGLAYGTQSADHLLNVPAARMSLDPAQPAHFVDWLRAHTPGDNAPDAHEFVPRQRYGDYLQDSLARCAAMHPQVTLTQRVALAQGCQPDGSTWRLQLAHDEALQADAVVLAIGHLPPRPPHAELVGLPGYVSDPWSPNALEGLAADAPVALIGTGLTMLDVLITLRARGHHGPLLALSRRGLLPQGHRRNELPPAPWALPAELMVGKPLRRLLKGFRAEVKRAKAAGLDWRDVWVAFRAQTPAAWQALDLRARSQFLRHLLPYWDVHRHRAAPEARAVLEQALSSGQLQQHAGRVVAARPAHGGIDLDWRPRGQAITQRCRVARVVNCSGPSSTLDAESTPLMWGLQQAGRLQACPLGLGVYVDAQYRLLDRRGQGLPGLHYVGPHLRAQHWEATAVPELREHAALLAACVVNPPD